MSQPPWSAGANYQLDERQAFDAMVFFVETFWERSGRPEDELAQFVTMVGRTEADTQDPAHWHDWLDAVRRAIAGTEPLPAASAEETLLAAEDFQRRLNEAMSAASVVRLSRYLTADDLLLLHRLIDLARARLAPGQ